jgi:RHS repeat-associated protein
VTIAGKPATGAGGTTFSGSAVLPAGTSRVAITATDASGNSATQSYDVDVPVSTSSSSYDANGHLIAQGTKTYEWDAANRLVRVLDDGTEIARFAYDGNGRRVQKTTSGTTRSYVYGGLDILEERSSSGTIRTVHGPGIDQVLASVDGSGAVSYYLADHLGSIVQQTNASASVTLTRQYDPYGVPLQGEATSGYAYTGREWDPEIALYYYRARYYDPQAARFISNDPSGLTGGINTYAYVAGNPIRYVDPSGLEFGDYWDIRATTAYYDSIPTTSYWWGPELHAEHVRHG